MKRVFLSFLAEDRNQVNGLRLMAANPRFDIEFYDESVTTPYNSTNAEYIRRNIREKINRTSVTVVLISQQTYTSAWVNWEITESIAKGNTIIPMGLPNLTHANLPPAIAGHTWWLWNVDYLFQKITEAP